MTEYLDRYPTMHEYAEGKRINPKLTDLISRADALNLNCVITVRRADTKERKCDDEIIKACFEAYVEHIKKLPSADATQGWIPLSHDDDGLGTDFPYERDGEWVIVTDGKTISVERIKKDAYDHFFPNGRWFELEDVIAWMPLPTPYKGGDDE